MTPYPSAEELLGPVFRVAMPRARRLDARGGMVHVVARCSNREVSCTTPEDFAGLRTHLRATGRTYAVPLGG